MQWQGEGYKRMRDQGSGKSLHQRGGTRNEEVKGTLRQLSLVTQRTRKKVLSWSQMGYCWPLYITG